MGDGGFILGNNAVGKMEVDGYGVGDSIWKQCGNLRME